MLRFDRQSQFHFSSLQGSTAQQLLPDFQEVKTIVYYRNSEVFVKSTAVLKIFSDLGGAWKGLVVFFIIPTFLRNIFYDLVASSRYTLFGKRETCELDPGSKNSNQLLP